MAMPQRAETFEIPRVVVRRREGPVYEAYQLLLFAFTVAVATALARITELTAFLTDMRMSPIVWLGVPRSGTTASTVAGG